MQPLFFNEAIALLRVALMGVMAYVALVLLLRVSGRRTLSKMNAFDLVVTVALGSILATVILNPGVTLAQGSLAFGLLIAMQYALTWSSVRWPWVRRLVTGEPALLLYHGKPLPGALLRARVTMDELRAAVRAAGLVSLDEVEAVVLETEGSLSVVRRDPGATEGASSLEGVELPGDEARR
ncbi:DUF421 domain-containing protein [Halomonas sp. HP20-15]|uniref:DUF421 domain-containing protein n=1 Tax=Halomonas sp. HP20-15 TaxID=3085901 RepID=UPI0029813F63|nr:YetF domain-containing protein [Halomonas sp. HP20-15]MDW5378006.1 DUF421 domain-containing protein [Halomonas sp. HP20-15]